MTTARRSFKLRSVVSRMSTKTIMSSDQWSILAQRWSAGMQESRRRRKWRHRMCILRTKRRLLLNQLSRNQWRKSTLVKGTISSLVSLVCIPSKRLKNNVSDWRNLRKERTGWLVVRKNMIVCIIKFPWFQQDLVAADHFQDLVSHVPEGRNTHLVIKPSATGSRIASASL